MKTKSLKCEDVTVIFFYCYISVDLDSSDSCMNVVNVIMLLRLRLISPFANVIVSKLSVIVTHCCKMVLTVYLNT